MAWWFWPLAILAVSVLVWLTFFSERAPAVRGWFSSLFGAVGTLAAGLPRRAVVFAVAIPLIIGMGAGLGQCVKEQGRNEVRLEEARKDKVVAQHETNVATRATELAEETHQDRERVRVVIDRAEEELEDAVSQEDFDRLYSVYVSGYCGVFNDPGCADSPDPAPAGIDPVRRSNASPV